MTDVVITGLGVVAPTGSNTGDFWWSTLEGASGVGRISRFDPSRYPVRYAGEVTGFDPSLTLDPRIVVQTDLWTQFALEATRQALESASLDPRACDSFDIGVTTSAGSGGNAFGQREIEALWAHGPRHVGPYQSIAWFYAASTGQISIGNTMRGPCAVVSSESAGGLDAVAHGRRAVRRGCRVQVCGGTEAPVSPYALTCQLRSGLLSERDSPAAYRPFSHDASGYVPGEGGAVVVLEDAVHARDRGARALSVVAGHAATFTGSQWAVNDRDYWRRATEALAAAIRLALADAHVSPEDIDVVFADGMAVPSADHTEIAALRRVFGPAFDRVPVTAPSAGLGRAYSAAGAFAVAAATLALRDGVVPPTPGLAGDDVAVAADVVTGTPRRGPLRHALVLARGFGGFSSALVLAASA
ncbi:beta-ketoacyl synthase N-terminal-like domain-containing protein [Saccharomonospora cyanea]|uniref:3-oxoacyl-(Acyl-carrier-protein) synthase n=1 Tax=Saccharomonospora cyanea NA-134 TaxID=882082 RepID=H5XR01_9PSEU|nr:beta-ketoacyl synthase N-terminal-like domain-containing protein [Saccharomonospora cyanea]EHR61241.1 3-oxoacyl-(acyl-carrier-protein) synthase [Saccharomonospora cyanea NA-134]